MQNKDSKGSFRLVLTIVFVYVVLFEFILPINKFLPKPSMLFDSIIHIWKDYSLLYTVTSSTSVVFLSLILGYISAYLNFSQLIKFFEKGSGSIEALSIFKYIPVLLVISVFYFWFSEHLFAEILFSLLSAAFMIYRSLLNHYEKVNEEYILIAKNLELAESEIHEKISWRAIQPLVIYDLGKIHLRLWGLVLLFEFVTNVYGLGHIIRLIIDYKDFTALFNIIILLSVLIWVGDSFIRFIRTKFIFWEA
jgi:ABC-type nitrate/sulfonate/bicarbonate transport system permease component